MPRHRPVMGVISVFKQINTLPGPQGQTSVHNWNVDGYRREGCFDMSRHIVRALASMAHPIHGWIIRVGHEAIEKFVHVPSHIWIGIFRNKKRARGVPDK